MSDALNSLEKQVLDFSLTEQIQLMAFIANAINKRTSELSEEKSLRKMREASLATVWESVKNDTW